MGGGERPTNTPSDPLSLCIPNLNTVRQALVTNKAGDKTLGLLEQATAETKVVENQSEREEYQRQNALECPQRDKGGQTQKKYQVSVQNVSFVLFLIVLGRFKVRIKVYAFLSPQPL